MGKNGSGKSTFAKVMAGHPSYELTSGDVILDGQSILDLEPDERARAGLFLAFQYPMEVPGVTIANFLRAALQARLPEGEELDAVAYYRALCKDGRPGDSAGVHFPLRQRRLLRRGKKALRNLAAGAFGAAYAVLDETDSGLDIDALKVVAEGVNALRSPERGFL